MYVRHEPAHDAYSPDGYATLVDVIIHRIRRRRNVSFVIWPAQQVVLGMKEGDAAAAAPKAGLASRTNTLFSGPMLFGMLGSKHLYIEDAGGLGFWACVVVILALEANALFGKTGPMIRPTFEQVPSEKSLYHLDIWPFVTHGKMLRGHPYAVSVQMCATHD